MFKRTILNPFVSYETKTYYLHTYTKSLERIVLVNAIFSGHDKKGPFVVSVNKAHIHKLFSVFKLNMLQERKSTNSSVRNFVLAKC